MARPVKWRRIEEMPRFQHFQPAGMGLKPEGENVLKLEELEAIRLKDLEGLEQEACADRMEVSRPTFQRILTSAREKIADSLIQGKAIRIDGGNYTRGICPVRCLDCGRVWQESIEKMEGEQLDPICPQCHSQRLECCPADLDDGSSQSRTCWGACRRYGRDQDGQHRPGGRAGSGGGRGRGRSMGRRDGRGFQAGIGQEPGPDSK